MEDKLKEQTTFGNISIADDVVASIAGIAAIEVKGVSKLTGNISKELVSKLGKKNLANGVKVEIADGAVKVDISVEIDYGTSIKKVSEEIYYKSKEAYYAGKGEGILCVGKICLAFTGILVGINILNAARTADFSYEEDIFHSLTVEACLKIYYVTVKLSVGSKHCLNTAPVRIPVAEYVLEYIIAVIGCAVACCKIVGIAIIKPVVARFNKEAAAAFIVVEIRIIKGMNISQYIT